MVGYFVMASSESKSAVLAAGLLSLVMLVNGQIQIT